MNLILLQEALDSMLASVNLVKKAMCTLTLPLINKTSSNPLAYSVVTFCESNSTAFEVSLITLNQVCVFVYGYMHVGVCLHALTRGCHDFICWYCVKYTNWCPYICWAYSDVVSQILTDLVLTKPNETLSAAGMSMLVFDQLQNKTSLWESLLAVPQLFSSTSDQALDTAKALLTNLQG